MFQPRTAAAATAAAASAKGSQRRRGEALPRPQARRRRRCDRACRRESARPAPRRWPGPPRRPPRSCPCRRGSRSGRDARGLRSTPPAWPGAGAPRRARSSRAADRSRTERSNTSVPSRYSFSWSPSPASVRSTTNRRKRLRRSALTNPGLARIRSSCARTASAGGEAGMGTVSAKRRPKTGRICGDLTVTSRFLPPWGAVIRGKVVRPWRSRHPLPRSFRCCSAVRSSPPP